MVCVCVLGGWPKPETEALCCSFDSVILPLFSLPLSLFPSVSSLPICLWFRHRLRGEASPLGERSQGREGGREREEVHTSLFYRTQLRLGLQAQLHLEVGAAGKWSQRVQPNKRSCPEAFLRPGQRQKQRQKGGISAPLGKNTNMAAKSLSCLCLLCILIVTAYPTSAARLGEQQQSVLTVRQIWFSSFLVVTLCTLAQLYLFVFTYCTCTECNGKKLSSTQMLRWKEMSTSCERLFVAVWRALWGLVSVLWLGDM